MNAPLRVGAAVIDLDGTLLDTAPDLVAAANAMRQALGLAPLPFDTVVTYVGKGAERLVHRALTTDPDGEAEGALFQVGHRLFFEFYQQENGRHAALFPQVREGLERMRELGLRLACVTNKPMRFTTPLLERHDLARYFELVLGGDSLPRRKPDPLPLLHAAQTFGIAPPQVVMIGDSINDARAARAAGMPVLVVPYGYNEGLDVQTLDVDGIVPTLAAAAERLVAA